MWLCDVNGVLVDSSALVREAFAAAATCFGFADRVAGVQAIKGLWLLEAYRILDPGGDARARREFHLAYVRERIGELRPFPHVRETLIAARAAGIRIGAVTSHGEIAEASLVQTGLYQHIDCLVTQEEVRRPKPMPDAVLRLITLLGGRPYETDLDALHIGDTAEDVEAGRAAAVKTIGVTYGMSSEQEIRAAEPDFVIHAFHEMRSWLVPAGADATISATSFRFEDRPA